MIENVPAPGRINRFALLARHRPRVTGIDPRSPLTVGNGEFCFTADATGLQTFPEAYPVEGRYGEAVGTLLGTMSEWGWHSTPAERPYDLGDATRLYDSPHGPASYVDLGGQFSMHEQSGQSETEEWLRNNPHRLDLARVGLWFGEFVPDAQDLDDVDQDLDLETGLLSSRFTLAGRRLTVLTAVHPGRDALAVSVSADDGGEVGLRLRFPYGSEAWGNAADWSRPECHSSEMAAADGGWTIMRTLDDTAYSVSISSAAATLERIAPHEFAVTGVATLEVVLAFTPGVSPTVAGPPAVDVRAASASHWRSFWQSGAAIEFTGSEDDRADELERRVVLSQYLTAIQCSGTMPPAETGLTLNSWRGKFHLEMHWWHAAHFAQWGRSELLERSLPWYEGVAERARETARSQGLSGVRWPKQVGPAGEEAPSNIGPFLVWQQPHPIYLAELLYRAGSGDEALGRWAPLVFETAEFMASFASLGPNGFDLGPPIIPAQESYADQRATAKNPTFELAYWSWALGVACQWRERLGLDVPGLWREVAATMAPAPVRNDRYVALATEPYLVRDDHPSMLAALGMVPVTTVIDPATMGRTLADVLEDWDWDSAWGWDFPVAAMTATRLGDPDLAVDALLMDRPKNTFLANGHNRQNASLPIYLPGNGGLLFAVSLMTAGWDGGPATPGFGAGWTVAHEGLVRHPA